MLVNGDADIWLQGNLLGSHSKSAHKQLHRLQPNWQCRRSQDAQSSPGGDEDVRENSWRDASKLLLPAFLDYDSNCVCIAGCGLFWLPDGSNLGHKGKKIIWTGSQLFIWHIPKILITLVDIQAGCRVSGPFRVQHHFLLNARMHSLCCFSAVTS